MPKAKQTNKNSDITHSLKLKPHKPSANIPKSYMKLSNAWLWFLFHLSTLLGKENPKYGLREYAEQLLLLRCAQSLEVTNKLLGENYYPESAASLRIVMESTNLIKLFQTNANYVRKWFSLDWKETSRVFKPSKVRQLIGTSSPESYHLLSNLGTHPSKLSTEFMSSIRFREIGVGKVGLNVFSKPKYNKKWANYIMTYSLVFSGNLAIRILEPKKRRKAAREVIAFGSDKDLISRLIELNKLTKKHLGKTVKNL